MRTRAPKLANTWVAGAQGSVRLRTRVCASGTGLRAVGAALCALQGCEPLEWGWEWAVARTVGDDLWTMTIFIVVASARGTGEHNRAG